MRKTLTSLLIILSLVFPLAGTIYELSTDGSLKEYTYFAPSLTQGYNAKGSAEFIDSNGTMVTAFHVASHKRMCVMIGDLCYPATLVAGDMLSDVAVIKVNYRSSYYLGISPYVPKPGTRVIKFGYPLSLTTEYAPDIKFGTILQCNIMCRVGVEAGFGLPFHGLDLTTWILNPGDSGGFTVDKTGGIVGINSAGDDDHSLSASRASLLKLLNSHGIKYEYASPWSKLTSAIIAEDKKTVKVVWISI